MKTKIYLSITFSLVLALLAASLPTGLSTAQGTQPNCPPTALLQNMDPEFVKSLPKECLRENEQTISPQFKTQSLALLLSSGGPDDFGYTYDDSVPFDWINVPEYSGITSADDYALEVDSLQYFFAFPFYGTNYSSLYLSSNGLITFGEGSFYDYGGSDIPNTGSPNNFIAPFWEDLVVGPPYNSGAVWYTFGGTAPNQYFVAEWRNVTTYYGSDPFSFQVILYENGDIVVQFDSLPAYYYATVGIENNTGDDGLGYYAGCCDLTAPKAIKFFYPTGPIARLHVSPLSDGKFASNSTNTYFPVTITNNGSAGTDTYDLTAASSWAINLYEDGCVTPLSDTDADTFFDTGPLPEGASTTVCVGFTPPAGADIGDSNYAAVNVSSSINPARAKTVELSMAIPAPFVQVFEDYADAAMAFRVNQPDGMLTNYVTNDFYYGNGLATIDLPDGSYIYVWRKPDGNYPDSFSDIEFTFLSHDGITSTPVQKLTSNIGTGQTYDYDPAVAVTPDGTIGVTWRRWLVDNSTGLSNYNIYFATLANNGVLLNGPTNVTNNNLWGTYNDVNIPIFWQPVIAGTDDNKFVLSWEESKKDAADNYLANIWYSTFTSTGTTQYAPAALTADDNSFIPVINSLTNGNVILTWLSFTFSPIFRINPTYAVINSNGSITKAATTLESDSVYGPSIDAVLLPNGNSAIALAKSFGVSLFILDTDYNIVSGPHYANTPNYLQYGMSATYDSSNRIIMTWWDEESYPSQNLFYALADDTGTFLTNPIPYRSSADGMITSENGQGNAPFITITTIEVSIDIRPGSGTNPVSTKSKGLIPVAILSTPDFDALSMVDVSSLTFGKSGDEESLAFCNSNGEDANGDALLDLVCHFYTQETGFQVGDLEGTLKGQTVDGIPLKGGDGVTILN